MEGCWLGLGLVWLAIVEMGLLLKDSGWLFSLYDLFSFQGGSSRVRGPCFRSFPAFLKTGLKEKRFL